MDYNGILFSWYSLTTPTKLGKHDEATVHQAQRELFRTELEGLVDAGHALVKLGRQMNWASFDEQLGQTYDPSNGAPGAEHEADGGTALFEVPV
jgi:hypothetical protein